MLSALLLLTVASDLYAHLALSSSAPTGDERLLAAPTEIRLSFTEPVELALSSVILTGPDGQTVLLGDLATVEARDVLSAPIVGPLTAGTYKVAWQAVGRDGHPVQGEFTFVIEEGATGLAAPVEEMPEPLPVDEATGSDVVTSNADAALPTFGPQSPLYAAVRWLGYVGILGSLGAIGFAMLLASPRLRSDSVSPAFRQASGRGAAAVGIASALLLGVSLPLRLQAQSHAVFGGGITGERFSMLLDTTWGVAWLAQAIGAGVVLAGLLLARTGSTPGWLIAGVGALALAITPALSGHAASVETLRGVALAADALHVAGVGAWLGTLIVLLAVAVPLTRKEPEASRGGLLASLLDGFSPFALLAAGVVLGTGVLASTMHLSTVSDLWSSDYGRLLGLKIVLVLSVLALGAFNWRRVRPRAAEPGADSRLIRSAGAELATAIVVVALTAVLVAVPAPAHSAATAVNPTPTDPAAVADPAPTDPAAFVGSEAAVDLAGRP